MESVMAAYKVVAQSFWVQRISVMSNVMTVLLRKKMASRLQKFKNEQIDGNSFLVAWLGI